MYKIGIFNYASDFILLVKLINNHYFLNNKLQRCTSYRFMLIEHLINSINIVNINFYA
jgi:hypothetical protein